MHERAQGQNTFWCLVLLMLKWYPNFCCFWHFQNIRKCFCVFVQFFQVLKVELVLIVGDYHLLMRAEPYIWCRVFHTLSIFLQHSQNKQMNFHHKSCLKFCSQCVIDLLSIQFFVHKKLCRNNLPFVGHSFCRYTKRLLENLHFCIFAGGFYSLKNHPNHKYQSCFDYIKKSLIFATYSVCFILLGQIVIKVFQCWKRLDNRFFVYLGFCMKNLLTKCIDICYII